MLLLQTFQGNVFIDGETTEVVESTSLLFLLKWFYMLLKCDVTVFPRLQCLSNMPNSRSLSPRFTTAWSG